MLGCLETPPAFLKAVPSAWTVTRGGCNFGSIRVLGCLETPPAFLEAVPSAAVVDALCASTKSLVVCLPRAHPPEFWALMGRKCVTAWGSALQSAKCEEVNYPDLACAKHSIRQIEPYWAFNMNVVGSAY